MKKLLACLLLCCLLLSACGNPSTTDPFAYLDTPLTITVRGNIRATDALSHLPQTREEPIGVSRKGESLAFSAVVSGKPIPPSQVVDNMASTEEKWRISISYTAPDALAGVTVSCIIGKNTPPAEVTLTHPALGNTASLSLPFDSLQGMLRPVLCLWPQGDVTSVSPIKDNSQSVTVTSPDGEAVYYFSSDSPYPKKIEISDPEYEMNLFFSPIT